MNISAEAVQYHIVSSYFVLTCILFNHSYPYISTCRVELLTPSPSYCWESSSE